MRPSTPSTLWERGCPFRSGALAGPRSPRYHSQHWMRTGGATVNSVALVMMAALLAAWIAIGVLVVAYGTPLGVALYVLAVVLTNPRIWRLH